MTYRLDSDIVWPYFKVLDIQANSIVAPSKHVKWRQFENNFFDEALFKLTKEKTKNIAWFVSHCGAISQRDELAKQLQNYLEVDIYGKCGTLRYSFILV